VDFPTRSDYFSIAKRELLANNRELTLLAVDTPFTDVNAICQMAAAMGDAVTGQLIMLQAGLWSDSAQGDRLTQLVFDRTGLLRKGAASALGSVIFRIGTALNSDLPIPAQTVIATGDSVQFTTSFDAVIPGGQLISPPVEIASVLAGRSIYARRNTITNIVSLVPNAPADLTVVNTTATDIGDDEQDDGSLRRDYRNFPSTLAKGVASAIESEALRYPGVRTALVTEILDTRGSGRKVVLLGITDTYTDALANLTSVPPTYEQQSQALASAVFNSLSDTRGAGIALFVEVARTVICPVVLVLNFRAGADVAQAAYRARVAVVNYINNLRRGESFLRDRAVQILQTVDGLAYTGSEIISPPGDLLARPLQVLRSSLSFVQAGYSISGTYQPIAAPSSDLALLLR